ncbi:MAG: purine-nucleoside phosphorylase [Bacteroidia bacterium]|nr:purine-nucleoside phosphorylase [Bacteroidia bacterium]MCX7764818.1 purine-nucleoside phosphorylase [Bacteroidia bacterium]MDW8057515.1 purine-nucleoside phosphorylase [Bacteroidia bacterium]
MTTPEAYTHFRETLEYIRRYFQGEVEVGIVLGTGLGRLAEAIEKEHQLAYNFIPHFPISTVESHFGRLIFGRLGGKRVVAMQGRFHYYEGYSMYQITYPIRIMKLLGAHTLLLSNAAGALNLSFQLGDLMIITDHINLLPENPLRGINLDQLGPRFPDMSAPYDPSLIARAKSIAARLGIPVREGVYVAVPGPNLETRAEYRFLRIIGGDAVGMSTVPECIVANHMGMRVFAMSIITDIGDPDNLKPVSLEEIIRAANSSEPKLTQIFTELVREL